MSDVLSGMSGESWGPALPVPNGRKLAIVGGHPDTRGLAPFDDPDWDIWVFNEAPQMYWCRRYTAVFQLHLPEVYRSSSNYVHQGHWDWLKETHGKPVLMQAVDPEVPDSVMYPLEEVLQTVPGGQYKWIESSPAYALALGLYLGYQEIGVWGVELTSNSEYTYQLRNWQFWVGVAHGMRVNLALHAGMENFQARLYGYQGELQIEREHWAQREQELDLQWKQADKRLRQLKTKIDEAMLKGNPDAVAKLVVEFDEAAATCGELAGAHGEAKRYAERTDPTPRQEFEFGAAKAQRDGEQKKAALFHAGGKAEYVWNVWKQTGKLEALQQLRLMLREKGQHAYDMGAMLGIYRENMKAINEYDRRLTAAGGQRALAQVEAR